MARNNPAQPSFTGGEVADIFERRIDVAKRGVSLKQLVNFLVMPQGPVIRRSGTQFIAETKDMAKRSALIKFEFNVEQAYALEVGEFYFRFFLSGGGILEDPPGTPVEVVTPYTEADLFDSEGRFILSIVQSADVLYLSHPNYPAATLSRLTATTWQYTVLDFSIGPFLPQNNDLNNGFNISDLISPVTVTAQQPTFASTDVADNRQIRIHDGPLATNGLSTTGIWRLLNITGFTSSTVVTCTFPGGNLANGSSGFNNVFWYLNIWSQATALFPSKVTFHEDRLTYATQDRLDMSRSGDYLNFLPFASDDVVVDSMAIQTTLNSRTVNFIRWMVSQEKGLLMGTAGAEWVVQPSTLGQPLSPSNVNAKSPTAHGSANQDAVVVDDVAIFLHRSGIRLREMTYTFNTDGFTAPNLNLLADSIGKLGLLNTTFQEEPRGVVWAPRQDGVLLAMTYERAEDVVGWSRHPFGGADVFVESVVAIPSVDGKSDEVWCIVRRTINGATTRYVELMQPEFESETMTIDQAYFVDAGLVYTGAPATVITGLGHLEGETVTILADGSIVSTQVVTGGQVTLADAASTVAVGLGYISRFETLAAEAGASIGTAMGMKKRISKLGIAFVDTSGGKFGTCTEDVNAPILEDIFSRSAPDAMDVAPPLFTGIVVDNFPGGYALEGRICIEQQDPLPMTIAAIVEVLQTEDSNR